MKSLCFIVGLSILSLLNSFQYLHKIDARLHLVRRNNAKDSSPKNPREQFQNSYMNLLKICATQLTVLSALSVKTRAIGTVSELKDQSLVLQDISFNVDDVEQEFQFMNALFQKSCKQIRRMNNNGEEIAVLGFGADAYERSDAFVPGISSFFQDAAHASITVRSNIVNKEEGIVEISEQGNGLQYIKVGPDVIRLSKGIQAGGVVKYGYGWVDIDSPGKIPYEVIIGTTRDPIMMACLRVSNVKDSQNFFTETLGMKVSTIPLARKPGSQFEPPQPPKSVYVSYGDNSMGLLLVEGTKKDPPLNVGSQLNGFTIVVDDASGISLPESISSLLSSDTTNAKVIKSPDGYPFILKPYSQFKKEATKIPPPSEV